jgi:hypothetical protein
MCEFTISLLDSKQPFEGLIEGLFENAAKLFGHVTSDQPKIVYWIDKIASFNMMCRTGACDVTGLHTCPRGGRCHRVLFQ